MDRDDLVRLRRARDQMDREYASPLDVAALADLLAKGLLRGLSFSTPTWMRPSSGCRPPART